VQERDGVADKDVATKEDEAVKQESGIADWHRVTYIAGD
jgi:hypothetical protein